MTGPSPRNPGPPPGGSPGPVPANSVRKSQAQVNRLLDDQAASYRGVAHPLRRQYVRWPFRVVSVELRLIQPGRSESTVMVACRDLSAGGLGALHGAYVYPGTKCVVCLPRADGRKADVEGVVVRCTHLQGVAHEIGIRFNQPVEARDYVRLDPFADGFVLEKVDPQQLKGTVLFIEESALDQSLVRHFLRQTNLTLIIAVNKQEVLDTAAQGVDLILFDYDRAAEDGEAILAALRDTGVSTPIIILTADGSQSNRAKLARARANAFIGKPLKQEVLFRAIAEFMVVDDGQGGLCTTLPADHPHIGLIDTFVEQVRSYAGQLAAAIQADDFAKCRNLCLQVAGAAPVMGFEKLAVLAQAAETALSSSMSVAESAPSLRTLMSTCKRVTARAAA